jgi:hypothetical protein
VAHFRLRPWDRNQGMALTCICGGQLILKPCASQFKVSEF